MNGRASGPVLYASISQSFHPLCDDKSFGDEGVEERENFCENQERMPDEESVVTKFSRLDDGGTLDDLLKYALSSSAMPFRDPIFFWVCFF